MFDDVGIYRSEKGMKSAIEKIAEWKARFKQVRVTDAGRIFNTELLNAWELGNMLEIADVIAECYRTKKPVFMSRPTNQKEEK